MQVRKYEASTIKEAVDLVKKDLGPDAIILSTREIAKSSSSGRKVTITAAVAEKTYQMKRAVESRLSDKEKEKLLNKPARVQKQFISSVYSNLQEKLETDRPQVRRMNYALIDEEDAPRVERQKLQSSVLATKEMERIDELKTEIKKLQSVIKNMGRPENWIEKSVANGNQPTSQQQSKSTSTNVAPTPQEPDLQAVRQKLLSAGLDQNLIDEVLSSAQKQLGVNFSKKAALDAYIGKWILKTIQVTQQPLQGQIHFFVGPRGVGKTSTLVKMASHLVIKEKKKVAILSADTNKVGAVDQLRIYSQILNVPFAVVRNGNDVAQCLQKLQGMDYILFDTQGLSLSVMEEISWIRSILPEDRKDIRIHLVLSALMRDEDFIAMSKRFKLLAFNDVIVTNLDQVRRYGFLVNFQRQIPVPYYGFGLGPMIPEDFEWATKERVFDLIFKISKTKWEGEKNV